MQARPRSSLRSRKSRSRQGPGGYRYSLTGTSREAHDRRGRSCRWSERLLFFGRELSGTVSGRSVGGIALCDEKGWGKSAMSIVETYAGAAGSLQRQRIDFVVELERAWSPPFPAALLRGGLGNLLRRRYCRSRSAGCRPEAHCAYCELFETREGQRGSGWAAGLHGVPVAMAVHCEPVEWKAGRLGIELFGMAVEHSRIIRDAVQEMGERGLGRERVRCVFRPVTGWDVPESCGEAIRRSLSRLSRIEGLRVCSESPIRIKSAGRWAQSVDPRLLVVNAARRFSGLVAQESPARALPAPDRALLERATAMSARNARWRWTDRRRFSARQRRLVPMGGVEGSFEIDLPDLEMLFFLALSEVMGVGKGIAFGFGRVRLEGM